MGLGRDPLEGRDDEALAEAGEKGEDKDDRLRPWSHFPLIKETRYRVPHEGLVREVLRASVIKILTGGISGLRVSGGTLSVYPERQN